MKMDKIANSHNDEFYTPYYAIVPLLKYIKPNSTIWCPFDTSESLFVKIFRDNGHKVINTHISKGENFFTEKVPRCDYIISNPPYSLKTEVIERLFEIKIPFAMLVGIVGLFESQKRFNLFRSNVFECMYFDKRISYFKNYTDSKPALNPPFSSIYICQHFLPKQIVFEEIDKTNLGDVKYGKNKLF